MTTMPSPERAFAAYRPLVEGYDQAMPMMLWSSGGMIQPIQLRPMDAPLADQLQAAFPTLLTRLGRPDWVLVSCEAWHRELPDEAAAASYRHGDMQRDAQAGDTSVGEAVFIVGVAKDNEWIYMRHFRRERGRVAWEPTAKCDTDPLGGVADVLRELVRG